MTTKQTIRVERTNYDRFVSESGKVYTGGDIRDMRFNGCEVVVTDRTPADQGTWVLEPLGSLTWHG